MIIQESAKPEEPLELISIDFFGPLVKTKYGYEYILDMIGTFTKYTKLYPLRKSTSNDTIGKLDDFITKLGKQRTISVKACNVSNTATGRVAKFVALYEGLYTLKKQIARNTYILMNANTD